MKVINTLAHMPFKAGDDLYFCHSAGVSYFEAPLLPHAIKTGFLPDTHEFHPWQLARLREGVVELFEVPGMFSDTPLNVFCNPVFYNGVLSFVHANKLYKARIGNSLLLAPALVKTGLFTGFSIGKKIVTTKPGCSGEGNILTVENNGAVSESVLPLTEVVRVIPHGESYTITGKHEGSMISILWNGAGDIQRITSEGADVYKCCIDGEHVIHTVKDPVIGTRFLHRTPLTLSPL